MQNRKRAVQLIVRVTAEEKDHIYKKMELYGTENFNAYARKMLIDGYVVKVDTGHFQELAQEVNKIGTNINQLAGFWHFQSMNFQIVRQLNTTFNIIQPEVVVILLAVLN